MSTSKRPKRNSGKPTVAQSKRFIAAAREHGASEDPKAFERVFAQIVPPKKVGDVAPRPKAKPRTP